MQAKALGNSHLLLILSAAEARALGIRSRGGCAMLLRTQAPAFSYLFCHRRRYRVRMAKQTFLFHSCSDMMNLIARLQQFPAVLPPVSLYAAEHRYALVIQPDCRHFFLLRCLCKEYGMLIGTDQAAAQMREYGRLLSSDVIRELGPHLQSDAEDAQ